MPKPLVLCAAPPPEAGLDALRKKHRVRVMRRFTRKAFLRGVRDADAVFAYLSHRVDSEVLASAPRLKVVANCAVGYNNVDWRAARARGVMVTHTPGVLTDATADLAWALVLVATRRVVEADAFVRAGKFKGWDAGLFVGTSLAGKTLGVFGMGRIGRAVASRARAFGMKILYHNRRRLSLSEERKFGARRVPFDALLRRSDVLTLHAPLTEATRGRFGAREFARMKRGAFFINTARGEMHDERALAAVLRSGRLAGAGLDVYEREPKVEPALKRLKNVVLLPHIGSAARETREKMAMMCAEDISLVLSGRKPKHPIPEMRETGKRRKKATLPRV